jgi:hypothetical protein|nr:MAG TPA: hypothetical protein [Caudoviricetes sp.]
MTEDNTWILPEEKLSKRGLTMFALGVGENFAEGL